MAYLTGALPLARAAAAERSQGLEEPIGEMPLAMSAMPGDAAKPRGAPPSDERAPGANSNMPVATSAAVAPELRPALAVATAVLRAVSQTPAAAPGSDIDPNAARLRDAAAALLAEGALGRLLAATAPFLLPGGAAASSGGASRRGWRAAAGQQPPSRGGDEAAAAAATTVWVGRGTRGRCASRASGRGGAGRWACCWPWPCFCGGRSATP